MRFNIRAISAANKIPADARVSVPSLLGARIEFRTGAVLRIALPGELQDFQTLASAERTLNVVDRWSRVFRSPINDAVVLNVLGTTTDESGATLFYRLDALQYTQRKGPAPPVQLVGDAIMTYEECANWLIELSQSWASRPDQAQQQIALIRPSGYTPEKVRMAWIGPETVDNVQIASRLKAIGTVYGAEIVHVLPRGVKEVAAKVSGALPLHAVVVGRNFARHVTEDSIPEQVKRKYILLCESTTWDGLEGQIRAWVEATAEQVIADKHELQADEDSIILGLMLKGMLSHSKIGQFSHCDQTEVLTAVVAQKYSVKRAQELLAGNSEQFRDSKESEKLFLWKTHNDGAQYFLNPQKVNDVKMFVEA